MIQYNKNQQKIENQHEILEQERKFIMNYQKLKHKNYKMKWNHLNYKYKINKNIMK